MQKNQLKNHQAVPGIRFASPAGETLLVRNSDVGEKVFVDYFNQDAVVLLQPYRRVYLKDLPSSVRQGFGLGPYAPATYIFCPNHGHRFSFDGSLRRSVTVEDLPNGQIIHVLPDAETAGVRVPLPPCPPMLHARAAAAVAA